MDHYWVSLAKDSISLLHYNILLGTVFPQVDYGLGKERVIATEAIDSSARKCHGFTT